MTEPSLRSLLNSPELGFLNRRCVLSYFRPRDNPSPFERGKSTELLSKTALEGGSRTKLIHAAVATPANVADSTVLPDLLHGKETRVWGDKAYRGQRAVIRRHAPKAQDFTNRRYRHRGVVGEIERAKNRTKSKIRARVEHSIGVIKRVFGFAKVRYRGLNKNTHRLLVTCALANLFMARRHLLRGAQA
jgi:IS5 family transposase